MGSLQMQRLALVTASGLMSTNGEPMSNIAMTAKQGLSEEEKSETVQFHRRCGSDKGGSLSGNGTEHTLKGMAVLTGKGSVQGNPGSSEVIS